MDITQIAQNLSETTEKPAVEIEAEITALMEKFGYNLPGAVATWKSDNKFMIVTDRKDYHVRVLAKEVPRQSVIDGKPEMVGNIHFLYNDPDTGEVTFNSTTCWRQERIDQMYGEMELGGSYKFKGRPNAKGNVAYIRDVVNEEGAPNLADVDGAALASIVDVIGGYEYVRGWVGRVINPSGQVIGFEVDDMGAGQPLTIWFAGQYSKMSPEEMEVVAAQLTNGAEVGVYGYISGTSTDVKMSASRVVFY